MFVCGHITKSGYIYDDSENMIHKETRRINTHNLVLDSLSAAKRMLLYTDDSSVSLVMHLTDEGGVESMWVRKEHHDEVKQRLRIWSGCYGSWPLHILSED